MLLHLLIPLPLPLLEEREEASALLVCGHGREKWWHRERKVEGLEKAEAARWNGGRVSSSLHLMSSARWHSVSMGAEILLQLWSHSELYSRLGRWMTHLSGMHSKNMPVTSFTKSPGAEGLTFNASTSHKTRGWETLGGGGTLLHLSPFSHFWMAVSRRSQGDFTEESYVY